MQMPRRIHIFSLIVCLMFFFGVTSVPVFSQAPPIAGKALNELGGIQNNTGIKTTDVPSVIGVVAQTILTLSGMFFLALMVYAGLKWMFARGAEDQIEQSRKTIIAATIGIIITASSYAITSYIVGGVITGSTAGGPVNTNPLVQDQEDPGPQGCCLVQVADSDSTGSSGLNFDQVGFGYWVWYMASENACNGHQAGEGTVIKAGPEWSAVDEDACQEAYNNK